MRDHLLGWVKNSLGNAIQGYLSGDKAVGAGKPVAEIDAAVKALSDALHNRIGIGPEVVPLLTFASAVEYFIIQRPKDGNVNRGAMLIEPHAKGTLFTQVFLDANLSPILDATGAPLGRRVIARALDAELQEKFGGKSMVLVG